ncbi:MAG: flavodoxin-dependent (E)-4-hydroxy-3-methylbut-2-enyl-diphosphate synthase, partial [Oscillospiraceae bacterium]|nr:flavodoxin-dependent (E)-4-hydroxy-3-methylbut-2-enyl-diphosphate synthase [Oscillospiraceae bacterium]
MAKKQINVGGILIGGGAPVTVQSMTNTKTENVSDTVAQIKRLEAAGCDIVRLAVPTLEAARAIYDIKSQVNIPIVADIHFDYKLAIAAAKAGADKIRINPGNIGGEDRVKAVVDVCKARNLPIRIGVNGGSLEKPILAKYGKPTAEGMLESAMGHVALLNKFDFDDICISVKASEVQLTIEAYRLMSKSTDYPLHLGVTEAGTEYSGIIKSAVGIGTLLSEGIGDTIRVSLTAAPEREIKAGIEILKAAGL